MSGAPNTPLTADLVARAVIAAALAYGDDPVLACTSQRNSSLRRSLTAAAGGLAIGLGVPLLRVERALPVKSATIYTNRSRKPPGYIDAEVAAARAVEFACWRPDAKVSVVAPAAGVDAPPEASERPMEPPAVEIEAAPPELAAIEPVVVAPSPEIAPGPRSTSAGRISSLARSNWVEPSATRGAPDGERPIADLVLEALADGPLNTMSLAYRVDRKEMAVSSALSNLEHLGLARREEVEGQTRRYVWHRLEPQGVAA